MTIVKKWRDRELFSTFLHYGAG